MLMALGVFITATHIYNVVVFLTTCTIVAQYWSYVPGGRCIPMDSEEILYIVGSALFTASDTVMLLFPMPLIWRMRTSWRRRLQLTCLFLLGSFVVVLAIVKTVVVVGLLLLLLPGPCGETTLRIRPSHVTSSLPIESASPN